MFVLNATSITRTALERKYKWQKAHQAILLDGLLATYRSDYGGRLDQQIHYLLLIMTDLRINSFLRRHLFQPQLLHSYMLLILISLQNFISLFAFLQLLMQQKYKRLSKMLPYLCLLDNRPLQLQLTFTIIIFQQLQKMSLRWFNHRVFEEK